MRRLLPWSVPGLPLPRPGACSGEGAVEGAATVWHATAAATTATAATGAAPLAATPARHTAATATVPGAATTTASAQGYGPAAATGPLALPPPAEVALAAFLYFLHATFLQPLPFLQLPVPSSTTVHLPPLFTAFPQMPTCLPNTHMPSAQPQPPGPVLTTPDSQLCDVIRHIPGAWAVVEGVRAARRNGTTSEYKITKAEIEAVLRLLGTPPPGLGQSGKAALVSYARQQLEGWLEHADAAHAAAMEGPRDALD